MTTKKFHLQIIDPSGFKVDEDVSMVVLRSFSGDLGILPNHDSYSITLGYGPLRIINEDQQRKIAIYGGLATVENNVLRIITKEAQWPEEIDINKAETDKLHTQQRLREKKSDLEIRNDQLRLRRALVQIEISSQTISSDEDLL